MHAVQPFVAPAVALATGAAGAVGGFLGGRRSRAQEQTKYDVALDDIEAELGAIETSLERSIRQGTQMQGQFVAWNTYRNDLTQPSRRLPEKIRREIQNLYAQLQTAAQITDATEKQQLRDRVIRTRGELIGYRATPR